MNGVEIEKNSGFFTLDFGLPRFLLGGPNAKRGLIFGFCAFVVVEGTTIVVLLLLLEVVGLSNSNRGVTFVLLLVGLYGENCFRLPPY
jgi:hypothetical protein